MKQTRYLPIAFITATLALGVSQPAQCYDPAASGASIGQPLDYETTGYFSSIEKKAASNSQRAKAHNLLQASRELAGAKKYDEALAKLREFDTIEGKAENEVLIANRTRVVIAYAIKDEVLLSKSLEAVIASNQLQASEKANFVQELAASYYRQKDFSKAITWLSRYISEGGTDNEARRLLIRSYYLSNDFARADKELRVDIQAAEAAGVVPPEDLLQLAASCAVKLKDDAAYTRATEKLVSYYPKKDLWVQLTSRLLLQPGFSDRLMLDVYRLMLVTGQLTTAEDFLSMSELALQNGFAGEAKKIMDMGFHAGVLGTGPDSSKHQQLLRSAEKSVDAKLKNGAEDEAAFVKAKNNDGLVDLGYAYVVAGQVDKGIALMEQGVRGKLVQPEEAKLHLGIAYALTGRKADAAQIFKSVQGTEGSADLARYWGMYLKHST